MKIAIVVHGRFHAFDLAKALLSRGHDVHLFTNYPAWAVARFGFPTERVHSCSWHGFLSRFINRLTQITGIVFGERLLAWSFGYWAAAVIDCNEWDVVHSWSGISKALLQRGDICKRKIVLVRGSTHIQTQHAILQEEEKRVGQSLEKPSEWMINREVEEYALAHRIRVISKFALESFLEQGITKDKLQLISSASPIDRFKVQKHILQERKRRIISGQSLRVLFVGNISYRKGLHDLLSAGVRLKESQFEFRFVGPVAMEAQRQLVVLHQIGEVIPKMPQERLVAQYAWADIFIFPSLEEGYPQVLAQAAASALPILTTPNAAGSDIVEDGMSGWIVPAREPKALCRCLMWASQHRKELVRMVDYLFMNYQVRSWDQAALEFERAYEASNE